MIFVVYINNRGRNYGNKNQTKKYELTDFKNDLVFKFMLSDLNDSRMLLFT